MDAKVKAGNGDVKTEPKSFERFIEKLIIEYKSIIKVPGRISLFPLEKYLRI